MPRLTLVAPLLLASCAASQAPIPVHGETPGRTCKVLGSEPFIGQPATSETGAAILKATNAAVLRWAPIGTMLTMDYRADRVTVRLGSDRKVTAINCG
jgi:hypothetical protein